MRPTKTVWAVSTDRRKELRKDHERQGERVGDKRPLKKGSWVLGDKGW